MSQGLVFQDTVQRNLVNQDMSFEACLDMVDYAFFSGFVLGCLVSIVVVIFVSVGGWYLRWVNETDACPSCGAVFNGTDITECDACGAVFTDQGKPEHE